MVSVGRKTVFMRRERSAEQQHTKGGGKMSGSGAIKDGVSRTKRKCLILKISALPRAGFNTAMMEEREDVYASEGSR
jgi:hypothetical protein